MIPTPYQTRQVRGGGDVWTLLLAEETFDSKSAKIIHLSLIPNTVWPEFCEVAPEHSCSEHLLKLAVVEKVMMSKLRTRVHTRATRGARLYKRDRDRAEIAIFLLPHYHHPRTPNQSVFHKISIESRNASSLNNASHKKRRT